MAAKNQGNPWTLQDVAQLKRLAQGNTPTRLIAMKMERTEGAVRSKASEKNISLEPHNRSPYGRRK